MTIKETSKVKKDDFGVTVKHIQNCARCGESHEGVWFSKFTRPIVMGGTVHNYWGICPTTREPIVMAMQSEQELVPNE